MNIPLMKGTGENSSITNSSPDKDNNNNLTDRSKNSSTINVSESNPQ